MYTAYSNYYGETLTASDYSFWTGRDCEKEYYALKAENDTQACAFFQALGAAKGLIIDGGYDYGQDKQDLQNMHKSNVAACMGKI